MTAGVVGYIAEGGLHMDHISWKGEKGAGTGNWSEQKIIKISQGMYVGNEAAHANNERELTGGPF